ncbi:hypothetical protein [Flagellimonas flava]|uniref:hypothetical protein n=1 Tax=Flagellimonas flava TaxID=570519 RepID=UPI003D65B8D9
MKEKEEIVGMSVKNKVVVSGVYFLIREKEIIYIGSGRDVHSRIRMHSKNRRMRFSHYTILEMSKKKRLLMEKQYIEKFRPLFNFMSNPDYQDGKKEVLRIFLTKFNSAKEVKELCGVNEDVIGKVVFERGGVPDDVIEKVKNAILSR